VRVRSTENETDGMSDITVTSAGARLSCIVVAVIESQRDNDERAMGGRTLR